MSGDTPEHSLEITDGGGSDSSTQQLGPDGVPQPIPPPPDGYELSIPGGAFAPLHAPMENRDWTSAVDESKVLCFSCTHGWVMWKHAPTRNVKPDGSPYLQREGYCLYPAINPGGGPLPLEDRFVLRCNQYVACDDPDQASKSAIDPRGDKDDGRK